MFVSLLLSLAAHAGTVGYYREPAVHGDTVVFTAEGDLWKVPVTGGAAVRLTSHPGEERHAVISPDGATVAFIGTYEGPSEVYTMPIDGGAPVRRTWDGGGSLPMAWTPDGKLTISTFRYATLPDRQLVNLDLQTGAIERVPLARADHAAWDAASGALIFTRNPFQGSRTKRYVGGTAQDLWRWDGQGEAVKLTTDYPGTSREPTVRDGRIVFTTDRDGTLDLWSMALDGSDAKQLTEHEDFDVLGASVHGGRAVYQHGADLVVYDFAADTSTVIDITLTSDMDHTREKWITSPEAWMTSASLSPTGDRVALTARGQVFVAPTDSGRLVQVTRDAGVRYREATFLPDGKGVVAMSDATGELEVVRLPADGVGDPAPVTRDGTVFRDDLRVSPDGKRATFTDKDYKLWVVDLGSGATTLIVEGRMGPPRQVAWAPNSQWLAFTLSADNEYDQIWLYGVGDKQLTAVTTDRTYASSPAWSPDGKWLYFVSDRTLRSVVGSPWGPWQPEPHLDETSKLYAVSLAKDTPSPWTPRHELQPEAPAEPDELVDDKKKKKRKRREPEPEPTPRIRVDKDGLVERVIEVPVPAGNYGFVLATADALFWTAWDDGFNRQVRLQAVEIKDHDREVVTVVDGLDGLDLSADRKVFLITKGRQLFTVDAKPRKADLSDARVALGGWELSVDPRAEWRQMLVEAWRLERDFFYDRDLHGNDYQAILDRHLALVDRITDRNELADLISQMVGELSALHTFVLPGDTRSGPDNVQPAALGAWLTRVDNGWRIDGSYTFDPQYPDERPPLTRPAVDARDGDVITHVDGASVLDAPDLHALLRGKAGEQVRLRLLRGGQAVETIVEPVSMGADADLRYRDWELTRQQRVEADGDGQIGYVHLRAMGGGDWSSWVRDFYPNYQRQGLIIDVRHNRGGNIDSWVLEKLLRKAWMYWSGRSGEPTWNMQYAFRGHLVVLCDERTASDGEAFSEGFKRLGLGPVIGQRTWGGEIWLSFSNWLVDRGIASAAEWGVYGPEGEWLIEGHGVEPDTVVDNPPHATFQGEDAQLDAAIAYLKQRIAEEPVSTPPPPPRPDKSRGAWPKTP